MKTIFAKIVPFLFLGMMVVILVVGLVLLSWLLIFGAMVGLVLFLIAWIREKLSPTKHMTRTRHSTSGRTIDHDDH
ncbi:MAG TPA: hypothetical protein VLJ15_05110 [Gammaproteobacteria bacterium]|nr:hypothetical protein [Gammaproteobacteria bacterium]